MYKSFNKDEGRTGRDRKPNDKKKIKKKIFARLLRVDGVAGFAESFGQLLIYFSSVFSLLSYVCGSSNIIARPRSEAGEEAAGEAADGKKIVISINLDGHTNARTHVCTCARLVFAVQNSKFFIVCSGAARRPRCERRARSQPQEITTKEMTN